jgi:hypothetical protein
MDLKNSVTIPACLQIVTDDVGWFHGYDERYENGPSRTGMPRKHYAADYEAINEIGRALGMKIKCAVILGEWDKNNVLKNVPNCTKFGREWDMASRIDMAEAEKCEEVIRNSEYIEFAVHGLMHTGYENGVAAGSEYYYYRDKKLVMADRDVIRERLNAFFEILGHWNFGKKIRSFAPTLFYYRFGELSEILREYGIKYVTAPFSFMECEGEKLVPCAVENGIITVDRNRDHASPWYAHNVKPPESVRGGFFGAHWPNFLTILPQDNLKCVQKWIEYFKKCGETFGILLSSDIAFASSQQLYKRFAVVDYLKTEVSIDLKPVKLQGAAGLSDKFYLSCKNGITPKKIEGGTVRVYERHEGFVNYEITAHEDKIEIKF